MLAPGKRHHAGGSQRMCWSHMAGFWFNEGCRPGLAKRDPDLEPSM